MRRGVAPRSALAVMGAAMLLAAAWAWVDPVFAGAPDENAHAAWVQHYAETGGFGGGTRPGYASSEQAAAQAHQRVGHRDGHRRREPPRDAVTYRAWLAMPFTSAQRGDAAGPNPARNNPPLYYVLAAGPYRLGEGSDFFTRVLLSRLLGVLFIAGLVLAVWHLAGEVLGDGPGRVVAAAVAGLMPMVGFVEGAVSPDALMYPLWAFVLLAGVRALRGKDRWILWLLLGTAAAVATKYQSLTLLPGVLLVLAVAAHRHMTFVAGPPRGSRCWPPRWSWRRWRSRWAGGTGGWASRSKTSSPATPTASRCPRACASSSPTSGSSTCRARPS